MQRKQLRSQGDQVLADADQTASDADQTASDADQTASDRDDSLAAADQRAADREQAYAESNGRGSAWSSKVAREASAADRRATHAERRVAASDRATSAEGRDRTADLRDANAADRDLRPIVPEPYDGASDAKIIERLAMFRAEAAAMRVMAAADRARAARERLDAGARIARLEAELEHAHLDELTGAYRREMGWLVLAHEVERVRRGDNRLAIVFVDVIGLKEVNDHDGHAAGDHLLQTLVETMRANLRSFDPIVRYGGDEFICGLGGIDREDAERRFKVIDRGLIRAVGSGISAGIVMLRPDETVDEVVARADAEMLAQRKSRRDQRVRSPRSVPVSASMTIGPLNRVRGAHTV